MNKLESLLSKLDRVQTQGSGSWVALCPAHDDCNRSLKVSVGTDNILVKCFGGCSTQDVLHSLQLPWSALFFDGLASNPRPENSGRPVEVKSIDEEVCKVVYQWLIEELTLSDRHRGELRARGLSDEAIDHRGYRSLTFKQSARAVKKIYGLCKEALPYVPGFLSVGGRWRLNWKDGLLIPVRGIDGNPLAFQIRLPRKSAKYRWFTTPGLASPANVHHPLCTPRTFESQKAVRLTEGPLKADIAQELDPSIRTLGVPGVGNWKKALDCIYALEVDTVHVAFDVDWDKKKGVAESVNNIGQALMDGGYKILLEYWNPEHGKGLDDLLANGYCPTVLDPNKGSVW